MGVEGCAVAGREGGHARGIGVELLLVEDGEVVGLNVTESYLVAQLSTLHPAQACRPISKLPAHPGASSCPGQGSATVRRWSIPPMRPAAA